MVTVGIVRPDQQLHLAQLMKKQREQLEEVVAELAERGEPISELEARLLLEAGNARLSHIEDALRYDARRRLRRRNRMFAKLAARVHSWTKPRIGILRHYTAKPLQVPARYSRTAAPANAPKISIVTPSFEQGRFLDRTIYSVVTQNYPALEYVVQDGGSTDDTVEVLHRFERLLTAWVSEPDEGQADAINRGFAQTNGEIMAWLNSDDLLLPGCLAAVARYFARHPDVDVVYGDRIMIDESDGQIGAWILPAHDDRALALADYVPQETLFWRRRVWNAVGGAVDPSFRFAVDWDLLLRFRSAGAKIVHLPRFLGAFRVHADQKTFVDRRIGQAECEQLRERVHGRPLTNDEVLEGLRRYFARHVRAHNRQRLLDRLPLTRVPVQTVPQEPPLRKPDAEARRAAMQVARSEVPSPVSPLAPPADASAELDEPDRAESSSPAARRTLGG
jgi:glycosyltransferase involved in cell wall biosynthesis